jgi:NDP-sugar pyrophosphorylase family protein
MTGTAQTEAAELHSIYKLGVVGIPTNMPMIRGDQADLVYRTEEAKFAAVVDDGPWFDIGTPQRYISAARGVLEMTIAGRIPIVKGSKLVRDSIVHQTASVPSSLARSSIGARSAIRGEVRDSIVGEDCRITGSAMLESCIVGDDVEISRPMHLSNAVICRDDAAIPRDADYSFEAGLAIAEF